MFKDRYLMAEDCPNCGEKDELDQWKGARMGSSRWGHNYSCCSDKCSMEFGKSKAFKDLESIKVKKQISDLKHQLKQLQG